MNLPLRVVKVGGSLLTDAELPRSLNHWLQSQTPAHQVLVCGGGALADAIRDLDGRFHLGEAQAHDLCLDVLHITARVLCHLVPAAVCCESLAAVQQACQAEEPHTALVYDCSEELQRTQLPLDSHLLPCDWSVTSDSIAARIARLLGAQELVLLKSTSPPQSLDLPSASAQGLVDQAFPTVAQGLNVRLVNLRDVGASREVFSGRPMK